MQAFQDAWISRHPQLSRVAVFCDDGKLAFPADYSFRSFTVQNPTWATAVICTESVAKKWEGKADEIYIVNGKGGALGPKQYIYSAPLVMPEREVIAYLDLDLIHAKPLPVDESSALHGVHAAKDVSAKNQTFRCSVTDEKEGIYHSSRYEAAKINDLLNKYLGFDQQVAPVINTGVVITSWARAKQIAHMLRVISQTEHDFHFLWKWMHSDRKKYFTKHREQAVFQFVASIALGSSKISILPDTENWQMIDPKNHEVYLGPRRFIDENTRKEISIMHFNGYANPKGPARKFARIYYPSFN